VIPFGREYESRALAGRILSCSIPSLRWQPRSLSASQAYAIVVLDTPGHGAGPAELALISIAGLLTSTGILLNEIADGRFIWLSVAAILLTATALASYVVLRRRRPARATAALAANR
jgi:hypothetical protein